MSFRYGTLGLASSTLLITACIFIPGPSVGEHDYSDFQVFQYSRVAIFGDPLANGESDIAAARLSRQENGGFLLQFKVFETCATEAEPGTPLYGVPCTRALVERAYSADQLRDLLAAFMAVRIEQMDPLGPCVEPVFINEFTWDEIETDDWPYACPFSKRYLANPESILDALAALRAQFVAE